MFMKKTCGPSRPRKNSTANKKKFHFPDQCSLPLEILVVKRKLEITEENPVITIAIEKVVRFIPVDFRMTRIQYFNRARFRTTVLNDC